MAQNANRITSNDIIERLEQGHASSEEWSEWERNHKEQVRLFNDLHESGVDWHSDDDDEPVDEDAEEEEEESSPWWKLW